jgi:hypothetical protein
MHNGIVMSVRPCFLFKSTCTTFCIGNSTPKVVDADLLLHSATYKQNPEQLSSFFLVHHTYYWTYMSYFCNDYWRNTYGLSTPGRGAINKRVTRICLSNQYVHLKQSSRESENLWAYYIMKTSRSHEEDNTENLAHPPSQKQ